MNTPPKLTDDETAILWEIHSDECGDILMRDRHEVVRAIESARDQQWVEMLSKQEPVVWRYDREHYDSFPGISTKYSPIKLSIGENWTPLYTAPQPQQWVGLTDEAIYGAFRAVGLEAYHPRSGVVQTEYDRRINDFARAIESRLREKNGGGA